MPGFIAFAAIATSMMGSRSARKAAQAQMAANREAIAESRRQYDQTRTDLMPWMESGKNALTKLEALQDDPSSITNTAGYMFRRDEGEKGLSRSLVGKRLGGRATKEAMRYNSDYATNEYTNEFHRLFAQSGQGAGVTAQVGQFGANSSNNISNVLQNNGTVQANAINQRYQSTNNAIQGAAQNYTAWNAYNNGVRYDPSNDSNFEYEKGGKYYQAPTNSFQRTRY